MRSVDALIKILATPDIGVATGTLADWATEVSVTPNPSLYVLSTQKATFVKVFGEQGPSTHSTTRPFFEDRQVHGKRDGLTIGFLEWNVPIVKMDEEGRDIISAVIEEIYRRLYVQNFFKHIQRPVDFTNQNTYFRDTAKLLSDCLSMEIIAIREVNDTDDLNCRAFFHYPDQFDDQVDFNGGHDMPPPFRELVSATRSVLLKHGEEQPAVSFEEVDSKNIERYGFLFRGDRHLKNVTAFAIFPIVFGDDFFGVVSCATTAPFKFSALERTVIQTAMQLIGVAISNFRKFHEAKRMTDVIYDQLFSATELEIAQSARHELQNIATEQALHIDELDALTRTTRDKELLLKLKDTGLQLERAISKLRYSGVRAAPKLKGTSVENVWGEATALMKERLNTERIKIKYVGAPLAGDYYADWLREAFLNLLFNSIDAFQNRPKQNRFIALVIQKESEASLSHELDYSDNAGGIAFSKLIVPDPIREANPGMSMEQLIFQPKVTSKKQKKGAGGWGLYLVRQAIRLHGGSISLRSNNKEGCTFRIQIGKDLQDQKIREESKK